MPEISTLNRTVQIGKETTPGTGVSAGKLLQYIGFALNPNIEMQTFRPMGSRVPSTVVPGKDSSTLSIEGQGTYSEIVYLFNSLLKDVTPTTVDTTGKQWLYEPSARTEETKARYTIEEGSATRAGKATYGTVTGVTLTYNRTAGLTISGEGFAQQYQDNIALTGSPTTIEDAPVLATHLNVYSNDTFGAIGTTKLTRDFNAELNISNMVGPVWPINSANASYASDVDLEPSVSCTLRAEADSTGMGLLTAARAGSTKYIRLEALSTVLAGSSTAFYKIWVDFAGKVNEFPGFDDEEGVKVIDVGLTPVLDSTFSAAGAWIRVTVVNKVTTL